MATIELDDRRRASFGKLGQKEHTQYRVTEFEDGSLLLEPAVVMTEHELALLRNPDVLAQVQHSYNHPEQAVEPTSRRPRKPKSAD